MADFCNQCAEELGLEPDFVGLTQPGWYVLVVCEGCGVIQVDHEGNCVSEDCIGDHRRRPGS